MKIEETKKRFNTEQVLRLIKIKNSDFWERKRFDQSIELFRQVAERVPAYKDFLKRNKIDPKIIKNKYDFQQLPIINKENYLKKYSLSDLCWDGSLSKSMSFSSSSGSTGEPFYFPRSKLINWQYSILMELFFKNSSVGQDGPVLAIITFGMGVWIAGVISYEALFLVGQRGYPISTITTGVNKEEIFKALQKLAPNFSQTILIGYPPFVKDIIDESLERGIDVKKLNLRIVFAAEYITEKFRDYLCQKAGINNIYRNTINIYGSADIGAMAWESTVSILIRRLTQQNPKLFNDIFPLLNRIPTLAQFNPLFINFEAQDGAVVLTGNNNMPLVRYSIGDQGGVFNFNEITNIIESHGVSLNKEITQVNLEDVVYQLPFVYVYERLDFSTNLYGLQVYPEPIKEVLLNERLSKYLTGKFTLETKFDKQNNQYLAINLEMKRGYILDSLSLSFKEYVKKEIFNTLRKKLSEFRELSNSFNNGRDLIKLIFWEEESEPYFKIGIKQKWVNKINKTK